MPRSEEQAGTLGPQDWEARYESGDTPWDRGTAHPELLRRLEIDGLGCRTHGHGARAFAPGCGRGWDALALARTGWVVTAMDFAPGLKKSVNDLLKPWGGHFFGGDVLEYHASPAFELLWEHTFFCAIQPEMRPAYGEMARRLVAYRGRLVALVFPADRPLELGGPPFRMTIDDLAASLGDGFRLGLHEPVEMTMEGRAWKEEWAVFHRLDTED